MSARAWAAFATVSTLWGIPYLFIKIAVDDGVPPAFLAFVRVALGAAVLMAFASRAGTLGALRGRGRWLALYALFEIVVPFPLIAAGERHVASSMAAIIMPPYPCSSHCSHCASTTPSARPGRGSSGSSWAWSGSWHWSASMSRDAVTSCWAPGPS
jgi:hypothetical protein